MKWLPIKGRYQGLKGGTFLQGTQEQRPEEGELVGKQGQAQEEESMEVGHNALMGGLNYKVREPHFLSE